MRLRDGRAVRYKTRHMIPAGHRSPLDTVVVVVVRVAGAIAP